MGEIIRLYQDGLLENRIGAQGMRALRWFARLHSAVSLREPTR